MVLDNGVERWTSLLLSERRGITNIVVPRPPLLQYTNVSCSYVF